MNPFILITGASSGIGEACAHHLGAAKNNLILLARRGEKLQKIAAEITEKYGVLVRSFAVDLTDQAAFESVLEALGNVPIKGLVNNAGLAKGKAAFATAEPQDIAAMIALNITAFTRVAQAFLPRLIAHRGHIVNISSIAGREAYEGGHVYCGTKAYVRMLSKALRIDLLGTGVRVTDIAPGLVNTEFSVTRFDGDKAKADAVYDGFVPLLADDIARSVAFAMGEPTSVNIEEMVIMPTAQASATRVHRGA